MLGVRSLSIGLSIALVVCTGVLVGTLSITTGQKTTADAREAGDRGVAATLASGDKDIRQMAARYLKAVTGETEQAVGKVLDRATTAAQTLRQFGETVPPEWMTANGTTEYLDVTMRMAMRQVLAANYPVISTVGWRWGYQAGVQTHFQLDITQAYSPNADDLWAVLESQALPGVSPYVVVGTADERGRMKDAGTPCHLLTYGGIPNVAVEPFGRCTVPREVFFDPRSIDDAVMMGNTKVNDSERLVMPAKHVTFGESTAYLSWTVTGVHVPVEHPKHIQPGALRSVNRLGYFTLSLDMKYISDVFLSVNVPAGTILYCVEKNPWTDSVGMLVATSYGRLTSATTTTLQGIEFDSIVPLLAVNHTFTEGTTELSPIAHHARHIFAAFPTHYEDAAVATNDRGEFLEWTLPTNGTADGATNGTADGATTTTYWYTVLHMKYANLNWYISMLVPRSSIMDAIDASVAAVQAQREQDKEDADEYEQRSLLITVVVTVVVACVLMGVSAVVTNKILSPLMGLERDMACVAVMNVEAVDLGGEMSALSEVRGMEESFRTMVKNLVEYKQYMPQSVLVTDTEEEMQSEAVSKAQSSTLTKDGSVSQRSGNQSVSKRRSSRGSTVVAAARATQLAQTDLRRKQITVVAFNIRRFLTVSSHLHDTDLQNIYTSILSTLLAAMKQYRGVCDTFAGDRCIVAHNAFTNQTTHKVTALRAAIYVRSEVAKISVPGDGKESLSLSFAACSGGARVGQMGCTGMKKVTIMSGVVPWAAALETYNKVRGYGGVADEFLYEDANASVVLRQTDVATFAKRTAGRKQGAVARPIAVYEVLQEQEVDNDEWMYQMENSISKEDPYVKWNTMFDDLVAGRTEAAKDALGKIEGGFCEPCEMKRLQVMVALGRIEPVALDASTGVAYDDSCAADALLAPANITQDADAHIRRPPSSAQQRVADKRL